MIDNQRVVNTRLRHCDHFVHRNRTGRYRTAHLLFDHCPIIGFHLVHALPDGRSGQRAQSGTDRGPAGRIADRIAHQRTRPGPQQSTAQGALVGVVRRAAARAGDRKQQHRNN